MEKADRQERIKAFIIDFLIASVIQTILGAVFIFIPLIRKEIESNTVVEYNFYITGVSFLYFLFKDIYKGQSIGKRIGKIAVRTGQDHQTPSAVKSALRNITIIIWPIELIYYYINTKQQRIGDKLADTDVFKIES